jgi:F-type H+-transporting ATPase subunit a
MLGGMKRELIPGRWQVAVEGLIGFVDDMVHASIGPEGKKYLPWVFTAFIFLLFANLMGNMPFGIIKAAHPFTVTSQFTITGVMSLISFAIVLGVGFWKHGFHFFSLFVPSGVHWIGKVLLFPIEFVSFLVRPFSLGLRPFIAMFAGHILLDIFGNFIVQGFNAGGGGIGISILAFLFVAFISVLELLVAAIQAYVFAILTALYINDAVNLH